MSRARYTAATSMPATSTRNPRKITFLTMHSWKSNRSGGFHKFAEASCARGIETVFFSFSRPYYGRFMHTELFNRAAIDSLSKGITYTVHGTPLHNVTLPTLKLPNACNRLLGNAAMNALARFSLTPFGMFCRRWLDGTDVFVFESADGIVLFDKLKKRYPDARFVYRPSDPLMYDGALSRYVQNELHIMRCADMNIIVNEEGLSLYRRKIPDFETAVHYTMLSNGVDIASYERSYPVPEPLQKPNTVLYVGAWDVDWPLLFSAARECPSFQYIVVCPNYPPESVLREVSTVPNLLYVPGIPPEDVPAWITNCSVVMVPYVTDFYRNRPLGITAKYYQAMAAKKPIVAYSDTPKLSEAGICVTYTKADFISAVQKAMTEHEHEYSFDLAGRSWETIERRFMEIICP